MYPYKDVLCRIIRVLIVIIQHPVCQIKDWPVKERDQFVKGLVVAVSNAIEYRIDRCCIGQRTVC